MQLLQKPTLTDTVRLNRLRCFGRVQRMEENRISKKVFYMNWETQGWEVDKVIYDMMKWGRMEY